jgi:hypothetical protein
MKRVCSPVSEREIKKEKERKRESGRERKRERELHARTSRKCWRALSHGQT